MLEDPFDKQEPFEETPAEEEEKKAPKQKRKKPAGRSVAYSAVSSALSALMIILCCYLPITVFPMLLISLSSSIIASKCGLNWAIGSMIVGAAIGLASCFAHPGIMIVAGVVFYPHALACCFLKKLDYSSVKGAVIRIVTMAVIGSLAVLLLFVLAEAVADFINLEYIIERMDIVLAYILLNVIAVVGFIVIDLMFYRAVKAIVNKI